VYVLKSFPNTFHTMPRYYLKLAITASFHTLYHLFTKYPIIQHCTVWTTGEPPYPRVIRSKTYRGYVKPRIIPNAICKVIQRDIRVTFINTAKFNWKIAHTKTLPTLNKVIIKCNVHYIVHLQCTFSLFLSLSRTYENKGFWRLV
jgi:hypothetical protein